MAAEIRLFPCLTDNFGYLIHDPATKATASIDAPEAAPILRAPRARGLDADRQSSSPIITTTMSAASPELKQKYKCRVIAPHDKSTASPMSTCASARATS